MFSFSKKQNRGSGETLLRRGGFTLIELLVVIAIIGMLSSIVLASLNSARMKARDAKRVSDLHQMRLALEQYYDDKGTYPITSYWLHSTDSSWGSLQSLLAPYMSNLPKDPTNNASGPWATGNYSYSYGFDPNYGGDNNVKDYDLVAQLEDKNNNNRCEIRKWIFNIPKNTWCGSYSPYLVADH